MVKPSEPPAGIARLAGALRSQGISCHIIDANIEGLYYLLNHIPPPNDTWSHRAYLNLNQHLSELRSLSTYRNMDRYRRAVADIGRLLSLYQASEGIRVGLTDYQDQQLSPHCSADLKQSYQTPQRNAYYDYYQNRLLPRIHQIDPEIVGISINYLSQALCAFSLIGLLKKTLPRLKIILGGGLITSWMQGPGKKHLIATLSSGMVDQIISGPGELPLLKACGHLPKNNFFLPDYNDLHTQPYLSPGTIISFSASDGCWWRRCAFCPERAEKRKFQPIPFKLATRQLRQLCRLYTPSLIHILDNAVSQALLKALVTSPPNAPWYGFVRIGKPLDDLDFCRQLAASGCVMLKLGLESGSQKVLDRLEKGVNLKTASNVLVNLRKAGISTYVYLLFGTPSENEMSAEKTLDFVVSHHNAISFLNLAVFNLPLNSPDAIHLKTHSFYSGDLALYQDFAHPKGWDRTAVRHFLSKSFKKHPSIRPIIQRDPLVFTSNHAPFFSQINTDLPL